MYGRTPLGGKLNGHPVARAVLLLGIHREELAFGEGVAAGLDPADIDLLRIPEGVSGARPTPDGVFYYRTTHRELYGQVLRQVRRRYDLVIDLHCGINEPGRCADLFCADASLLECVAVAARCSPGITPGTVRPILLEAKGPFPDQASAPTHLHALTVIPEEIWRNPLFSYLCIEVFLPAPGAGDPEDWAMARRLIAAVIHCSKVRPGRPLPTNRGLGLLPR